MRHGTSCYCPSCADHKDLPEPMKGKDPLTVTGTLGRHGHQVIDLSAFENKIVSIEQIKQLTRDRIVEQVSKPRATLMLNSKTDQAVIQINEVIRQREIRARQEMLDMIIGSLEDYPNLGGDINVMKEVERIEKRARRRAAHECARIADDHVDHGEFYHGNRRRTCGAHIVEEIKATFGL